MAGRHSFSFVLHLFYSCYLKIRNIGFPLLSFLINLSLSLKEEWDLKHEDSPAGFIEVTLEVKEEEADDSSVFHSVDENCTTNKVIIFSVDLFLNFPHYN